MWRHENENEGNRVRVPVARHVRKAEQKIGGNCEIHAEPPLSRNRNARRSGFECEEVGRTVAVVLACACACDPEAGAVLVQLYSECRLRMTGSHLVHTLPCSPEHFYF